jgi:hypothetical protein
MITCIHRTHLWRTVPSRQWLKESVANGCTCSWLQPTIGRRDCSGSRIELLVDMQTSVQNMHKLMFSFTIDKL